MFLFSLTGLFIVYAISILLCPALKGNFQLHRYISPYFKKLQYTLTFLWVWFNYLIMRKQLRKKSSIISDDPHKSRIKFLNKMKNVRGGVEVISRNTNRSCVFQPASGCCAHPKAGWNPFWAVFNLFCSFQIFFGYFSTEIKKKFWKTFEKSVF